MSLSRRAFLRAMAATGVGAAAGCRHFLPDARRPNLLLILADDLGFSDLGCYGSEIPTPNLDALAAGGLKFGRFLNAARCCPARASLLTGQWPHQTGIGHMASNAAWSARYFINEWYAGDLRPETRTLAEALRFAGYGTYAVGKWHVTRHIDPAAKDFTAANWPCERGFDHYYGKLQGADSYFRTQGLVRDHAFLPDGRDADPNYYFTRACAEAAIGFLREHHAERPSTPFFLYLAFTAPHLPLQAPAETIARHKGRYDAGYEAIRDARLSRQKQSGLIPPETPPPPLPKTWGGTRRKAFEARCMEIYAAMVEEMDAAVGKVIAELRAQGTLDNTLVIFLSDNGACAEATGRSPTTPIPDGGPETRCGYGKGWAAVSNTPFREYKHWVHEGGIATPCIVHWPAAIPPRRAWVREPCHLVDIMATLPDLTGCPLPKGPPPEGVSLLPLLLGGALPPRIHPLLFEHEGNRALVEGDWKLVAKGPKGPWELYDLANDRNELHNLATAYPNRLRHMIARWEAEAQRTHILPSPFLNKR